MPCRINRKRLWTARLLLESFEHEQSYFVTLTYNNENLPQGGTLVPKHLQDFLKRLRKAVAPRKIRFFAVGEYGEQTFRPHYHLCVFGAVADRRVFSDCWTAGHVDVGEITKDSCAYIAGYCIKKLTKADDPRLGGRHPEFTRMSLRPGIGHDAAVEIARFQNTAEGSKVVIRDRGVLGQFRYERRKYPLGRYLRSVIARESGHEFHDALPRLRLQKLVESLDESEIARREQKRKADVWRAKARRSFVNQKRKL